jgi:cobalamin synthase
VPDRDEWMRRLGPVYPGLVALARTTSLVAPETPRETEADLGRAAAWVIAAGAIVGAAAWLTVKVLVKIGATPALAALAAVIAAGFIAGAVGERGFARWMQRARLGEPLTIASVSLVRWIALVSVAPTRWVAVMLVAPIVGRWAAVFLQAIADPAPFDRARRSLVVGQPTFPVIAILTGLVGAAAVLGLGWTGALGVAGAAVIAFVVGLRAQRRSGGIDGDVIAAAAVLGELAILLAAALAFPTPISPWTR